MQYDRLEHDAKPKKLKMTAKESKDNQQTAAWQWKKLSVPAQRYTR